MTKRIFVFGTGIVASTYLNAFSDIESQVAGYLESSGESKKEYRGKRVFPLSAIRALEFDEIHVANSHYGTVEQIINLGVETEKIVLCYLGLVKECMERNGEIIFRFNLPAVLTSKFFHANIFGDEILNWGNNRVIVNDDYCRIGTLQLLIEEVKMRNIKGELAELGVYRGDFSKHLNRAFADRKLFLFDTFEGFSKEQETENVEYGFSTPHDIVNSSFVDTSIQTVMDKMVYPEQIVICKGLFPNSIPANGGVNYAIVSLDCDLYSPILDGLRYFYPRLSDGGYIMIHDYNNDKFSAGIKKAVSVYEEECGFRIPKVPLPDEEGTLVVTK